MRQIVSLQFLRAFAAISVAVFHYQFDMGRLGLHDGLPPMKFGLAGVDVFFVVSGFVMVYTSQPSFGAPAAPRAFLLRRFFRIVPLYWLVTSAYLVLAAVMPAANRGYSVSLAIASFLFIPMERLPDTVEPVVGQGWTLNYEIFFYVLFSLALLARKRVAVMALSAVLVGIVVLGHARSPLPQPLAFWSDNIILEFAFGMVLALLYCEGVRLPKWAGWLSIALGCVLLYQPVPPSLAPVRSIYWGIPAACIVAGACLADFAPDPKRWRPLILLGDASYALYLTHSFANRAVLFLAAFLDLNLARAPLLYLFTAVAGAVVLAVAIYWVFEKPVGAQLKAYVPAGKWQSRTATVTPPDR